MMKFCAVSLVLLVLGAHIHRSRSKLLEQVSADDEDEGDDWDEDEEDQDDNYRRTEIDDDGRIYKNPRNSPSAMCPRDEEQAERLGQKCLRKCSTDEDCKSKKKKCRCDGACGMSCIKPDRECPELIGIEHGGLTVSGKFFGDAARYSCDPGYFVVGLTERTCRADGHWTGNIPSCKKDTNSFCTEPPKIKNAKSSALPEQTTFDLDSTVRYFCYHGHSTEGFPTAKCLTKNRAPASWFGPDISCKPKNCGLPANIANGWHAGECHTYDCRVSYHCEDDYELVGRAEKICLADGTWAPKELPQCVQVMSVQCLPPENPRYGKAVYSSCSYNSIVSYECKYGYTIVGDVTRRCGADRLWSGQTPVCKEINCGPPGTLYNGWIENIEAGTGLGASIIFRCNPHMKLEGNASSVCQIDGSWRYPVPRCLAPCVAPQIENGRMYVASEEKNRVNNATVVEHGEKLIVVCKQDYEFSANKTPVVCMNGTWTVMPICTPARCKQMPKTPRNGIVIAPKTEHGMRAVFKCKDGFELKGDSRFVECNFGNWTGDIPQCHEVFCPFPGYVINGKVLLVGNMGVYDLRPYVKKIVNNKQIMYDCDRGYVLSEGPPGATCIGGYWSPRELPKCIPGQHPRLRWSRRRRSTVGSFKKSNSSLPYKKVIDFFKRISRKVLHLGTRKKSRGHKSHGINGKHRWQSSGNYSTSRTWRKKKFFDGKNETGISREKMINFLEIIYKKLAHVDAKQRRKIENVSMHELLNVLSINSLHVDLEEAIKNSTGKNGTGLVFRVENLKEFAKYRRGFEKIVRFYSKPLQFDKQKENHRKSKKFEKNHKSDNHGENSVKIKKQKHKADNRYRGFYKFLNDYLEDKLSNAETQNATADLIKKMNINIFTIKNGTTFTISDFYSFFKHIIENKINDGVNYSNESNELTTIATTKASKVLNVSKNATVPLFPVSTESSKSDPDILNNEIPSREENNVTTQDRGNQIENSIEQGRVSFQKRKLLSLDYPLSNRKSQTPFSETNDRPSRRFKSKQLTLNELEAQQQSHLKRFLAPSEIANQIFLKNLYLTAYEDEYRANVKRSIIYSNRTHPSLYEIRGRREVIPEYQRK